MKSFSVIIILLIVTILFVETIVTSIKKGASGLKLMLLGINLTLFGGIIAVDSSSSLLGIEYLIALIGLIISIVGLRKNN